MIQNDFYKQKLEIQIQFSISNYFYLRTDLNFFPIADETVFGPPFESVLCKKISLYKIKKRRKN